MLFFVYVVEIRTIVILIALYAYTGTKWNILLQTLFFNTQDKIPN